MWASLVSIVARLWEGIAFRLIVCSMVSAASALLLSKERFGDTGGALALFIVGVISWLSGPGPASICPLVLVLVGSYVQATGTGKSPESPLTAVVNLGVITCLFVGIGWAGKLRRRALSKLQDREQRLQVEARQKDLFLATLSHELRNPLAPLSSCAELLRLELAGGCDQARLREIQEVFQRQLQHLVRLVDDLLDLSRINCGKIVLQPRSVTVREVMEDAARLARPNIESRRHTFDLRIPNEEIWLHADPARLVQVFSNLLNNASKFTEMGGSVAFEADRTVEGVRLVVTDSGIGLAPESLSKVFEMFTQIDSSDGRKQGGLGIGLNLAKRIVELHHGSIEAHSAGLGQGSRFDVRLPIADKHVEIYQDEGT